VIDGQTWRSLGDAPAVMQAPLILAVVSKSSQKTDYQDKRKEYADRDISEYWVVDFLAGKVCVLTLKAGQYQVSEFGSDDKILSSAFPNLKLTAAQILNVQAPQIMIFPLALGSLNLATLVPRHRAARGDANFALPASPGLGSGIIRCWIRL
jgi:Putative restriction endonuclease